MDRHIARTIVRNSAGDARVIWSIFSGYHPQELRESVQSCKNRINSMEFTRMSVHFFLFSSLIGTLLTISFTSAFRLNDVIDGRLKHIPLKRTRPDGRFGFLRGKDFEQFDKELRQLFIDDGAEDHTRLRRSVDGTVRSHNRTIIDEFELKGDNHSVAFLHWAGKKSSVGILYLIKRAAC